MDKYYSYTDFLKAMSDTGTENTSAMLLQEIYLDMFLDHIHREQVVERLELLIDQALDTGNQEKFMLYTGQLHELHKID
ncbi:IDEAL domain-containing protein [Chryseomicrobium sp. FSL W7-1435]|uniref:IDEAL domain-containing protein n=1 Tax=Chryseomicrobium sp. FSL W7-1435 TaxID=2921704 RepID=UPI00315A98CC